MSGEGRQGKGGSGQPRLWEARAGAGSWVGGRRPPCRALPPHSACSAWCTPELRLHRRGRGKQADVSECQEISHCHVPDTSLHCTAQVPPLPSPPAASQSAAHLDRSRLDGGHADVGAHQVVACCGERAQCGQLAGSPGAGSMLVAAVRRRNERGPHTTPPHPQSRMLPPRAWWGSTPHRQRTPPHPQSCSSPSTDPCGPATGQPFGNRVGRPSLAAESCSHVLALHATHKHQH
jgi:hypothetical protein